jgi:protoheme IX farnesyltransferase
MSLILVPMGTAGWLYASVALASGSWLLYLAAKAPQEEAYKPWAVRYFYGTLYYLPAVTIALAADTLIF